MSEGQKTLKQLAKEAKNRLKSGFWQNYENRVQIEMMKAEQMGVSKSKVKDFYTQQVTNEIKNNQKEEEEFYLKVKKLLDEEGEISGAIGRLTDREVYDGLTYEEKQRYNLELSEKYIKAVERYKAHKALDFNKIESENNNQ